MADPTQEREGIFKDLKIDFPAILAINIFLTFAAVTIGSGMLKMVFDPSLIEVLKNIVLLMVGFYFGSSAGSKAATTAIIGQMAPAKNPPNPPVAPVETQWWTVLTDAEKAAITAAALTDAKVNAFMVAAQTGHASSADLAYLVVKKLLTSDRAAEIQAA